MVKTLDVWTSVSGCSVVVDPRSDSVDSTIATVVSSGVDGVELFWLTIVELEIAFDAVDAGPFDEGLISTARVLSRRREALERVDRFSKPKDLLLIRKFVRRNEEQST